MFPDTTTPTPLPPGDPLLGADPLTAFAPHVEDEARDAAHFALADVEGPGFSRAWHVRTTREIGPPWTAALHARPARAIDAGDVILLRFFARSPTNAGRFDVFVRKLGHTSNIEAAIHVGTSWEEFLLPFFSKDAFTAEAGPVFEFRFGFPPQTVEIGGVEVLDYGHRVPLRDVPRTRFSYAGREAGAAWREEARARIEQLRKRDVVLRVVDAHGRPVAGARVDLTQTRSAFHFGAALQMRRLVVDTPDNLVYRRKVEELFNAAGTENDLKWVVCACDWGSEYSHEQTLAGLRWLRRRGLHTRGHVLVWPGWKDLPRFIKALHGTPDEARIPALVRERIVEIIRATRGLLDEWDVVNEPCDSTDLLRMFGRDIMAGWFSLAREELPDAPLYLNDFGNHDQDADPAHVAHFEETARFLQSLHAPISGLGIQAHMTGQPSAPTAVLATLDRYATLGLPIRFTEFDVWTDDEELQADYTRDFLTLAYSHAAVVGVQFWGFWENAHWRRNAALFRADWSEKPNGRAYRDLVLDAWRTRASLVTDVEGLCAVRAFHGDYAADVSAGGATFPLHLRVEPGSSTQIVSLPTP